tara:strand:+ start:2162 stop:2914 length:753 start_codon:yes stop_codon:yes gene_type:complete
MIAGLFDKVKDITRTIPDINKGYTDPKPSDQPATVEQVVTPVQDLARQDVLKSVVVGAVAGAATAYTITEATGGDDSEKWALIGAGVGAVGGLIAGNVAAKRRKAFASEQAYLEAEISDTKVAISSKEQQIVEAEARVRATQQTITDLQKRQAANEDISEAIQVELTQLGFDIKEYEATLARYEASLEYLEESLGKSKKREADTAHEKAEVEALQAQLSRERGKLLGQFNRLNGIKESAEKSQQVLIAMK